MWVWGGCIFIKKGFLIDLEVDFRNQKHWSAMVEKSTIKITKASRNLEKALSKKVAGGEGLDRRSSGCLDLDRKCDLKKVLP